MTERAQRFAVAPVETQRLFEIGNRRFDLAVVAMRETALEECVGTFWIEPDRFVVVVNRAFGVAFLVIGVAAVRISIGLQRLYARRVDQRCAARDSQIGGGVFGFAQPALLGGQRECRCRNDEQHRCRCDRAEAGTLYDANQSTPLPERRAVLARYLLLFGANLA